MTTITNKHNKPYNLYLIMEKNTREAIERLIHREVVPAIGCTEPAAVALCVAKATEILGKTPESITVRLSSNMLKNAMGVGIPGTGMIGLPIAIALGALIGKSEYGLEVLRDVCDEAVARGKEYIASKAISIKLFEDAPSNLHIDVEASADTDRVRAVISREHTNFIYLEKNRDIIYKESSEINTRGADSAEEEKDVALNLRMVYDFAMEAPLEEISFMLEARDLNSHAAEIALAADYGHSLGSTVRNHGASLIGDSPLSHMISYTSAACDARMGGAPVAVMSNSGSGNQGITATMPVVSFAEDIHADEEHLIRALTLSHLTSIYIKQSLGRLSALCGCVVASTGASSALVYLMGGGYPEICSAVKNMVANLTGMICDGAKPGCALKIATSVGVAMRAASMACMNRGAGGHDGIVEQDVEATLKNLGDLGTMGMSGANPVILEMLLKKQN